MAIVAAPIVALSAIAIKLADRGPVFYRQTRVGESGREFELLKLRTLTPDADSDPRPADEKVTAVGRILQRLHVNELPQIWQVLKGDMSLVGPRPEIPRDRRLARVRVHLLRPPAPAEARDHRLGHRPLRLLRDTHRRGLEALSRPLLPEAPLPLLRPADHARDGQRDLRSGADQSPRRALHRRVPLRYAFGDRLSPQSRSPAAGAGPVRPFLLYQLLVSVGPGPRGYAWVRAREGAGPGPRGVETPKTSTGGCQ